MRRTLFALALLLLPAVAAAQPVRFEVTPFGGYRLKGDFDARSSSPFDPNLNVKIDASAVYGVLLDIPLGASGNWQLELLANRQRSSFVVDRGVLEPTTDLGDVDLTMGQVGLLLQWGHGQVNPFLTLSGGLTRIEPRFRELASDTRVSGSFGGGVKIFLAPNIGLRLEAREYWTDLDTGFRDRYDRYGSGDGLYQGEGSVGLIIAF
jgi:Outer membrane protein beta-barrel domain